MISKNDKNGSTNIVEIIKGEIIIISFMLFFVTFLFTVNIDTKGVFAKPLFLFLASALLILYGLIIRISGALIEKRSPKWSIHYNKISLGFYISALILFVFSCDLLLVGIDGFRNLPQMYHRIRIIIMVLVVIPIILLASSLLYNLVHR